jgi:hypothetical protein
VSNNDDYGIYLSDSNYNEIYLNNFIDNNGGAVQGYSNTSTNAFTNGTLGNYWSDYTGGDLNGNGIGDGTYSIDGGVGAVDPHPLMVPVDITPPELDTPGDVTYNEGSTGNNISWIAGDINPTVYNVTLSGSLYVVDTVWSNGTITVAIDGLSVGTYTIIIQVYDLYNNSRSDTVIVTVVDATLPDLDSPSDFSYTEGTTGNTISWIAGDRHPDLYNITLDGNLYIPDSTWSNGTIIIDVDGLSLGPHTIVITLYDSSGNSVSDSVLVTVTEVPPTSKTTPISIIGMMTGLIVFIVLRKKKTY